MPVNLLDLTSVIRRLGRGALFYSPVWSPGTGDALTLLPLGDTEGDIQIAKNSEMVPLTLPELTGPAPHELDYTGEAPVLTVPMYLSDPEHWELLGPSGTPSAGRSRRSAPAEYTIVCFPESLMLKPDVDGIPQLVELDFATGTFLKDGQALTAAEVAQLASAFWLWRCAVNRPDMSFRGASGDGGKAIETVTIMGMHHGDMPEGHHLYTIGNPFSFSIDLNGGS